MSLNLKEKKDSASHHSIDEVCDMYIILKESSNVCWPIFTSNPLDTSRNIILKWASLASVIVYVG